MKLELVITQSVANKRNQVLNRLSTGYRGAGTRSTHQKVNQTLKLGINAASGDERRRACVVLTDARAVNQAMINSGVVAVIMFRYKGHAMNIKRQI